jgi:glycosyltransferase involved in cell wall biosynthesis
LESAIYDNSQEKPAGPFHGLSTSSSTWITKPPREAKESTLFTYFDGTSKSLAPMPYCMTPIACLVSFLWCPIKIDYKSRADRPALIISSTSWTPDEDFGILLNGLCEMEGINPVTGVHDTKAIKDVPRTIVIITGKGPERPRYEALIAKLPFQRIKVITGWLTNEDYPELLGIISYA